MLVKLMGIHKVKATLADGRRVAYYYAWRGGPRINEKPETKAFFAEFARLTRSRPDSAAKGTLAGLIRDYVKSEAYQKRKASTRKGYDWAIDKIEAKFFDMELDGIGERGMRKMFLEWRDETFGTTPRAADMVMAVFSMILSFGVDREDVDRNPLADIQKLADPSRREIIWTDEQIAKFKASAPPRLVLALELARWTGQRQGDLLRLTWSAYDGTHISVRQGKTGAGVRVKVARELKAQLDAEKARIAALAPEKRKAVTILTNRSGLPYSEGFRSSWDKAMTKAGIEGVHFHDLRGTFVTLAYREGSSIKEIAEVTGHMEKDAERIIKKHYLQSDSVVTKLEQRNERVSKSTR
jgi:integrase